MTTVLIDDALAARLRALRDGDDLDRLVSEALAEMVRRWEWEAAGRAEMRAMLDGPRRPSDPQAAYQRSRAQYGWEDLSLLTDDELSDRAQRLGLL